MADYYDQRHPTFIRLDSQAVDPPPRRSSRASRQSQASARTWIYNSQQNTREPPSIIIPIAPPERAPPEFPVPEPAVFDGLDGEEYMNIDPDGPDLETAMAMGDPHWTVGSPASSTHRSSKGFIGGFFHRVRNFPKAIFRGRSRKRKPVGRNTMDAGNTMLSTGTGRLPSTEYGDHGETSAPDIDVEYVDGPSIPVPEPVAVNGPPLSRSAGLSLYRPGDHITHPSRAHSRASHQSHTPRGPTPSEALSAALRSPVQTERPLRTSNIAKMTASTRLSSAPSMMSQVFRFDKFLRDLKSLPWISTRITVDYIPGEGRRSHRKSHKTLKSPGSWYTHPHHSLDLLSSGTSGSTRSPYSHRHTRHSSPSLSPGYHSFSGHPATRHRTHSRDTQRKHGRGYPMYPHGFSPYAFNYSPQPLFVMQPPPSQTNSPPAPQQTRSPQQNPIFPELRQAVPVYMVPPSRPPESPGSPMAKPSDDRRKHPSRSRDRRHPEVNPYPLSMPGHPPPSTT